MDMGLFAYARMHATLVALIASNLLFAVPKVQGGLVVKITFRVGSFSSGLSGRSGNKSDMKLNGTNLNPNNYRYSWYRPVKA